jgi:hypothetical protein
MKDLNELKDLKDLNNLEDWSRSRTRERPSEGGVA